jgi:hypothetical protein
MQTEIRQNSMSLRVADVNVGLYDYGDGDVLLEIDSTDGGAILRPADIFQIIAFLRRAVEGSKTNDR